MRLRTRLLLLVSATIAFAVVLTTWTVSRHARSAFETLDLQRTRALVAEFRREFAREGDEVVARVGRLAASETMQNIAVELGGPSPDRARYVDDASALASSHGLDFLDIVADDGTIISSAEWRARFGYKHPWATTVGEADRDRAFLQIEETPSEPMLALVALHTLVTGDRRLSIAGGRRLDQQFLGSLSLPAGMRALLYRNIEPGFAPQQLVDGKGRVAEAERFESLVARARLLGRETADTIDWPDGPETFQAIPLAGREGSVLGVLLVGSSGRELAGLIAGIRRAGVIFGGIGILLGITLSYVVAARVTRPVEDLARGANAVAGGNWDVRVDVPPQGEVGELAEAFNAMTAQLLDQRDRLVQAERVAAWREIARRLAHELKNPLFPMKITVENLQRAKAQAPELFDEVFEESARTLFAELNNLGAIIGRFGDFAKMPAPRMEDVALNALVADSVKLFEAQFAAPGRPAIVAQQELDEDMGTVRADPEQLGRALRNLLANAIDAMPGGGRVTVRTRRADGGVRLEISDTGEGLTPEEASRLFTLYYTTRQHGTGLGLAIVQSVVSDHRGKISVRSEKGRGTTFLIELPG